MARTIMGVRHQTKPRKKETRFTNDKVVRYFVKEGILRGKLNTYQESALVRAKANAELENNGTVTGFEDHLDNMEKDPTYPIPKFNNKAIARSERLPSTFDMLLRSLIEHPKDLLYNRFIVHKVVHTSENENLPGSMIRRNVHALIEFTPRTTSGPTIEIKGVVAKVVDATANTNTQPNETVTVDEFQHHEIKDHNFAAFIATDVALEIMDAIRKTGNKIGLAEVLRNIRFTHNGKDIDFEEFRKSAPKKTKQIYTPTEKRTWRQRYKEARDQGHGQWDLMNFDKWKKNQDWF